VKHLPKAKVMPAPADRATPNRETPKRETPNREHRFDQVTDPMKAMAKETDVSEKALAVAVAANHAVFGQGDPSAALRRLSKLGEEGFRAVVILVRTRSTHYRTWELFDAARYPGAANALMRLAVDPGIRWSSWAVLEGLGTFDTEEVREFLLAQLEKEEADAGRFMAASKALGHLRESRAVEPIAKALGARRENWSGVAPYLIASLVAAGGERAVSPLAEFLTGDVPTPDRDLATALRTLMRLDPAAAKRAAAKLAKSPRAAGFSDALHALIRSFYD
jgi:hypothetical protein